jgi:hypothetical protein
MDQVEWEVHAHYDNNGDAPIIGLVKTIRDDRGNALEIAWINFGKDNVGYVTHS